LYYTKMLLNWLLSCKILVNEGVKRQTAKSYARD
jgi:hypothetical protein